MKMENSNERNEKIISDLKNGDLSYAIENPNQTDRYYYTSLKRGTGLDAPTINVFYNKKDGIFYAFKNFKEGMPLHLLYLATIM